MVEDWGGRGCWTWSGGPSCGASTSSAAFRSRELARRTGHSRNTIRAALRATGRPSYERAPAGSKLDPFKDEIHRLLKQDPKLSGQRIRELISELGFEGGKTIVDGYLREVRPLFDPPRTFQRTVYRPGGDLPVRSVAAAGRDCGRARHTRRGWVVVACLGFSRAGAGRLVFSTETPELLAGMARCLWRLGGLPQTLVRDCQSGLHAGGGRPTEAFAGFCGQLKLGWHFCEPGDPQAKGVVERLQDFIERSFEPGRRFANELDFQLQLDTWFDTRANPRMHRTLRARPIDRLAEELEVMAPLPRSAPDTDRRWVTRVPPDPLPAL